MPPRLRASSPRYGMNILKVVTPSVDRLGDLADVVHVHEVAVEEHVHLRLIGGCRHP